MKWLYLPFMLALAFFYTKISYNKYLFEGSESSLLNSRTPAATSYRFSASAFYKTLSTKKLLLFSDVSSYKGAVVGDLHVDNFGYVINDRKKADFTINSFNEVTEGILCYDVLNHLVSANNLDRKISWINYFEAYKKGLRGDSFEFSFYAKKGIDDALFDSENETSRIFNSDLPFEFSKIKNVHGHVDTEKKTLIQNEIEKIFPKVVLFDLIQFENESKNYQLLVRVRPQDKIQWIEIQESDNSSYDKFFNKGNELDFQKRVELLKENIYSGGMDKSIFSLKIDNINYIGKFKEQFISKIKLDQIPNDDFHYIVMDEAYVLGKIHSKSLGKQVAPYINSWAKIPTVKIDEEVINLKFNLRDQKP